MFSAVALQSVHSPPILLPENGALLSKNRSIGSEDEALFRVQKESITTLSTAQGLASDNVSRFKMRSGDTWVGSWPAGLSRVDDGHVTAFTKQDGVPWLVRSLYEDRAGALWVATHNGIRTLVHNKLATPPGLPKRGRAGSAGGSFPTAISSVLTAFILKRFTRSRSQTQIEVFTKASRRASWRCIDSGNSSRYQNARQSSV